MPLFRVMRTETYVADIEAESREQLQGWIDNATEAGEEAEAKNSELHSRLDKFYNGCDTEILDDEVSE